MINIHGQIYRKYMYINTQFKKYSSVSTLIRSKHRAGADPDLVGGGGQFPRPKVAESWEQSEACLRALEAFGFLMLKYAFSHILETLFL